MDIQGYTINHWLSKTSEEHPVLVIYDRSGRYYESLPCLKERKVKVIDTTKAHLHAQLSAHRYWCKELLLNKDNRMVIYRKCQAPSSHLQWLEEPFAAFMKTGSIFPFGPQDEYINLCHSFFLTSRRRLTNCLRTAFWGSTNSHDRYIRTSNNWDITLGRGLHIYQDLNPEKGKRNYFQMGTYDLSLRPCMKTRIFFRRVMRRNNFVIMVSFLR